MRRLLTRFRKKLPGVLKDNLAPRESTLQIVLKRKGQPVAGIYVDDKQELRSPSLEPEDT